MTEFRALSVAVLGAAGTIAPAIIHDLAESEEVGSIALLDLDAGKAAAVAEAHGAGKAAAAAADARDVDALARALQGGTVDYGDPVGKADTIYTLHSELATFGASFGCQSASFRLSLAPLLLERLRELAYDVSPEVVAAAARDAASPSNQTVSGAPGQGTGG